MTRDFIYSGYLCKMPPDHSVSDHSQFNEDMLLLLLENILCLEMAKEILCVG